MYNQGIARRQELNLTTLGPYPTTTIPLENVSCPLGAQKKPSCGIPHQISFRQDTSSIFIPTLFYAA